MASFPAPPEDHLKFGRGESFDASRLVSVLGLSTQDVSRIASVPVVSRSQVRPMPQILRDRLEEIATTVNLVAQAFGGDAEKTIAWFGAANPLLGDISPRQMIRLGRHDRLRSAVNDMIGGPDAAS